MSSAWTKFGGVALTWPPHVAWAIISRTADVVDRLKHRVYLSPYSTLERCENTLEDIKTYIQGISPERRQKIQTAAERGVCLHLVDVEVELERIVSLYEQYYDLCRVYENFSFFDRHIPGAHIRGKLMRFEHIVMEFYKDAWKTTEPGDRSIDWAMILNEHGHRLEDGRDVIP